MTTPITKKPATLVDVIAVAVPAMVTFAQFMRNEQKSYEVIFLCAFCIALYFYVRSLKDQLAEVKNDNDSCEARITILQNDFIARIDANQRDFEQRVRTMHNEHETHVREENQKTSAKMMVMNRTVMALYNDLIFFADKRKVGVIGADPETGVPIYTPLDRSYPPELEGRARNKTTPRK